MLGFPYEVLIFLGGQPLHLRLVHVRASMDRSPLPRLAAAAVQGSPWHLGMEEMGTTLLGNGHSVYTLVSI